MLFIYFEDQFSMRFEVDYNLLPFSGLPFCLIDSVFCLKEVFQFQDVPFYSDPSHCVCYCHIQEVVSSINMFKATSQFFSINFSITSFMLKSLIYLNLSFVWGDKKLYPFFVMSPPTNASTIC